MSSRLVRFNFTPEENEQIEAVIKLPEERRSIIHGIVKDHRNNTVRNAVVKLFEVENPNDEGSLKPITHAFTDECGEFLFGPLMACKHYAIKVWVDHVKIRELIIHPDECDKPHHQDSGKPKHPDCDKPKHQDSGKPHHPSCDSHKHHGGADNDEDEEE